MTQNLHLNGCTSSMELAIKQLVLKRKKKKMALLEKKILELKGKLDPIKDTQQIINFNNNIKKKLEKIDKETHKKKLKKFSRDMNDFKKNSVCGKIRRILPHLYNNLRSRI